MVNSKKQNRRNRRYGRGRRANPDAIEIAATFMIGLPIIATIFALAIYS